MAHDESSLCRFKSVALECSDCQIITFDIEIDMVICGKRFKFPGIESVMHNDVVSTGCGIDGFDELVFKFIIAFQLS